MLFYPSQGDLETILAAYVGGNEVTKINDNVYPEQWPLTAIELQDATYTVFLKNCH